MRGRRVVRAVGVALALVLGALAALRWWPGPRPRVDGPFVVIAHRGVHQTFAIEDVDDATCTARVIRPPTHRFIENTLPSMAAAFEAGADVVELDVHETRDGQVVVFHDWTLDCRTDGTGVTRDHDLATLKRLDVGYGYTADGGRTFPLRGSGVGAMPTIEDVLAAFPRGRFLVHQKSGDVRTLEVLARRLAPYGADVRARLSYYGPLPDEAARLIPGLGPRYTGRGELVRCVKRWMKTGGLAGIGDDCGGRAWLVPERFAGYLWGYPDRLATALAAGDAKLVLTEIDTLEALERVRDLPIGGLWTNRIEVVGPALRERPIGR